MRFIVASLITVGVVVACVTTPDSGRKQFVIIPEGQMNAMGASAYEDIKKKEKKSKNRQLTATIVEIGEHIAKASGKSYKWEFNLFESKQVNAFCLPGGKIGVYTGIIPIAKTNAGLAAIMGHEVAHATARHSAERASQTVVLAGGAGALNAAFKSSKWRGPLMAALGVGAQFGVLLPYSRKHESEADAIGLKFMAKAGYDPTEAAKLWDRMGKLGGTPPEFMSTHPDPARRARDLRNLESEVAGLYRNSAKRKTVAF